MPLPCFFSRHLKQLLTADSLSDPCGAVRPRHQRIDPSADIVLQVAQSLRLADAQGHEDQAFAIDPVCLSAPAVSELTFVWAYLPVCMRPAEVSTRVRCS